MRKSAFRTACCILCRAERFPWVRHPAGRRARPLGWGLPGGRVEPGEDPEAALRRELREELRIRVGELRLVGDYCHKGHVQRVLASA